LKVHFAAEAAYGIAAVMSVGAGAMSAVAMAIAFRLNVREPCAGGGACSSSRSCIGAREGAPCTGYDVRRGDDEL